MIILKTAYFYILAVKINLIKILKKIYFKTGFYKKSLITKVPGQFFFFPNPFLLNLSTTRSNDGVVPMSPLGAAAPPEGVYEPTKKSAPAPAGSFEGRTFFVGSSSSSARACAMCLARPFWVPQPGPRSARATGSRANAGRNCQ